MNVLEVLIPKLSYASKRSYTSCSHVETSIHLHNGRQTRDKCAGKSACKTAMAECYMNDILKHDKIVSCQGSVKLRSNVVPCAKAS